MNDEIAKHLGSTRGFAGMSQDKQRNIASKGGRRAHQKGTAHEFSTEEARKAGHLGGVSVSRDRAHMAAIGRQGGKARRHRSDELPHRSVGQPSPVSQEN